MKNQIPQEFEADIVQVYKEILEKNCTARSESKCV